MVEIENLPNSRSKAKAEGSLWYFTGSACKNGHISVRYTDSGTCKACRSQIDKRHHWKHRDKRLAAMNKRQTENYEKYAINRKKWYAANREEVLRKSRAQYRRNVERHALKRKEYYRKNRDALLAKSRERKIERAEIYKPAFRLWCENNRLILRAHSKRRKLRIKTATPPWAEMQIIDKVYILRPKGYHVDHVVPLRAASVIDGVRQRVASGLHVHANLQYLTGSANSTKTNNWSETESSDSNAIVPFSWEHFLVISEQS